MHTFPNWGLLKVAHMEGVGGPFALQMSKRSKMRRLKTRRCGPEVASGPDPRRLTGTTVWGLESRAGVQGLGFRVQVSGCRVQGFRVLGLVDSTRLGSQGVAMSLLWDLGIYCITAWTPWV